MRILQMCISIYLYTTSIHKQVLVFSRTTQLLMSKNVMFMFIKLQWSTRMQYLWLLT